MERSKYQIGYGLAPMSTFGLVKSSLTKLITPPLKEYDLCSIPIVFLSPLIVYLPGSDLVYGSYEILHNKLTVGASRMTSSLVKCMILAMGLTCGWNIVGYGFMKDRGEYAYEGANASYVPNQKCAPFTKPMNVGPWWVVFAGWNLVLLFPAVSSFVLFCL